ncbi:MULTISPECIES: hypothetical protein [unclassified Pusillimonas]|uniref:hypothetical protein n=1 Tax=unclassified Pusillimonas TaxID=2640016 RepID=UPI000B9D12DA|nr:MULTISPECIES: hypothetical protein [unclassified Pusillimonas]OXR49740.1 hypothetical protein PuT2_08180 [Pusillimonas sp. T2]ROT45142.1 hypothetical protein CHR62_09895 [Pusillimonas sp. NJUB218]
MHKVRAFVFSAFVGIAAFASGSAIAADKNVTIVNGTKTTMVAIYASTVGASTWEEDILGEDVLGPGESVEINMDDGSGKCMFDVKAEFKDGTETIRADLNVCKVGELTFTE